VSDNTALFAEGIVRLCEAAERSVPHCAAGRSKLIELMRTNTALQNAKSTAAPHATFVLYVLNWLRKNGQLNALLQVLAVSATIGSSLPYYTYIPRRSKCSLYNRVACV
jgi:hypothetical protein